MLRLRGMNSFTDCCHRTCKAVATATPTQQAACQAVDSTTQLLYSLADASTAVAASDPTTAAAIDTATQAGQRYTGWFRTVADSLETVLGYLQVGDAYYWSKCA